MMKWWFVFLLSSYVLAEKPEKQASVLDFCDKYAKCRSSARAQLLKCTGGFSQMILSKHGANMSVVEGPKSFQHCEEELASIIDKSIRHDYERIEEMTFKCTEEMSPSSFPLDKTQRLICQAIYTETDLNGSEIRGINSSAECYQVYDADLRRCELIKSCCPQYEHCQTKTESDSGIGAKEKIVLAKLQKCLGINITTTNTHAKEQKSESLESVEVRFAPKHRHRKPKAAHHKGPTATPVPRTRNGTVIGHNIFVISDPMKKIGENKSEKKEKKSKEISEQNDGEVEREVSNDQLLREVFCNQYIECEDILKYEESVCEQRYGTHSEDDSGIADPEIRSIFVNSSQATDPKIRHKCLENVDPETQGHLIFLKSEIARQNSECTMRYFPDGLELDGCQNIKLMTELSKIQRTTSSGTDLSECKGRLDNFRRSCRAYRACCPQKVSCEMTNHSPESLKYEDIISQVQLEQRMCEQRHQRLKDGLNSLQFS